MSGLFEKRNFLGYTTPLWVISRTPNDLYRRLESKLHKVVDNTSKGLTLAELMFAMGLIGIIMVFVIGLGVQLTNSSTKGVDQTIAMEIAQRLINQAAKTDPSTWPTATMAENITVTDPRTPTAFYYTCTNTMLSDYNKEPMGDLHQYQVTVFWWPNQSTSSSTSRSGYGKLSVRLSRVLYVENMR